MTSFTMKESCVKVFSVTLILCATFKCSLLFASESQRIDVVFNKGKALTNSRAIEIDPLDATFPQLWVSLGDPSFKDHVALENMGKPFVYTLPERNAKYNVFLRFADENGNPQGPLLTKMIELDTIPPVVKIMSPVENSTIDQGFVHVQATVFDPAPDDLTKPGTFRRLAVWLNGERYWNMSRSGIDIPRFLVQSGPNKLGIVAEDEASNRTEAVVNWTVNLDADKTAPTLSQFNLRPDRTGRIVFPNDSQIWVQGRLDDSNAIVTATVNGGEPIKMNARGDVFGYLIPLPMGESKLVLSAIDGAGNAKDYNFIVVRSDRYRSKITSPKFGAYANGQPQMVMGYVSALRDAGTKDEAHLVRVLVNDIPTVLGEPDADGNIVFSTTQPVPVAPGGRPTSLDVEIHWSDGLVFY